MAEFEKWKNPPKANFVISKKLAGEEGAEVYATLTVRVLLVSGSFCFDSNLSVTAQYKNVCSCVCSTIDDLENAAFQP